MQSNFVEINLSGKSHGYEIRINSNSLKNTGEWVRQCVPREAKKLIVVSNPKIFRLHGQSLKENLENTEFESDVFLMGDGEKYKSLRTVEKILEFFSEKRLKRTDAVIAFGGGVVGDAAGFAAAIFQRGTSFLQIPTTLLSMIDSSVGGKTGVNTSFGKNLVGAFYQPNGVLIDVEVLQTLPRRELAAGFYEAIKQGVIANENLFNQTADFLKNYQPRYFKKYFGDENFAKKLENLIAAQVAFKAAIVCQDEYEDALRCDEKSRKILNFGHTLAHALEKATGYKHFKHGEAVGYGILFAAAVSKKLEIFDESKLNLLNDVLRSVGELPDAQNVNLKSIYESFTFDKKNIGKSLQWVLLEDIGKPKIVEDENIPPKMIQETLKEILRCI